MAVVRIVLVRPEQPANIGAAARAAANMGLAGLDLVAPGDWRTVEAWRMAWGAQSLLESARVFSSLDQALADAVYTAGLTGRPGKRVAPMDVREMASEVASLAPEAPVALVFGPESQGLNERELLACQRRVSIRTDPRQPSLNLAQAVMVTAYELFTTSARPAEPRERAPASEVTPALESLREALLAIGFLPADNPEARFVEWREIFGRAGLSSREVSLIRALARRLIGVRPRLSEPTD
jgi:tRNA/rRNA methyltransferase